MVSEEEMMQQQLHKTLAASGTVRVVQVGEEQERIQAWPGAVDEEPGYPSEAAAYIMGVLLPEWSELFLRKHAGYGEMHYDLGMLGQAVDIHRKAGKLKRALIEGKPIGNEGVREVAMDLIGHAFLLLQLHDGPYPEGKSPERC